MTYQTRTILRRVLPIVFWLLAVGGCIAVPLILQNTLSQHSTDFLIPNNYWWGFLVAAFVMLTIYVLSHIDRHKSSAQENFQMAVLLGVASYWLPTVLFLTIPCWIFIMTRFAFNFRAFLATVVGYTAVAIHAALCIYFGWIDNVWAQFFSPSLLWGWIPVAAFFAAWLGTTIVRKSLRER